MPPGAYGWPQKPLRPGQRPTAADTNAVARAVSEMDRATGTGRVGVAREMGGFQIRDFAQPGHWARITGPPSGDKYPHTQVYAVNGVWADVPVPPGVSGTADYAPAREANGSGDVAEDTVVWLERDPETDLDQPGFVFQAPGGGSLEGAVAMASNTDRGFPQKDSDSTPPARYLTPTTLDAGRGGMTLSLRFRPDTKDGAVINAHGVIRGVAYVGAAAGIPAGTKAYFQVLAFARPMKMMMDGFAGTFLGTRAGTFPQFQFPFGLDAYTVFWSEPVELSTSAKAWTAFNVPWTVPTQVLDYTLRNNYEATGVASKVAHVTLCVLPVIRTTGTAANLAAITDPDFCLDWGVTAWGQVDRDYLVPTLNPAVKREYDAGLASTTTFSYDSPITVSNRQSAGSLTGASAVRPTFSGSTPTCTVRGRVTTHTGEPAGGRVVPVSGFDVILRDRDTGVQLAFATTDASGYAKFLSVPGGKEYEMMARTGPDSLMPPSYRIATPGDVTVEFIKDALAAPNASVYPGDGTTASWTGSIQGQVTGLGGTPGYVRAFKRSDQRGQVELNYAQDDATWDRLYSLDDWVCKTDTSGNYKFWGLLPGDYIVKVDPFTSASPTPATTAVDGLAAGQQATGIDFAA